MASHTDSDAEDLVLRLSQLSRDDFDEQIAQLPQGSASANHVARPTTPASDEEDGLAQALKLSQLSPDEVDEPIAQLHTKGTDAAINKSRSSTPPDNSDEDYFELALDLSQLPAEIFDEQIGDIKRLNEARRLESLFSHRRAMSAVEVRPHHPDTLFSH